MIFEFAEVTQKTHEIVRTHPLAARQQHAVQLESVGNFANRGRVRMRQIDVVHFGTKARPEFGDMEFWNAAHDASDRASTKNVGTLAANQARVLNGCARSLERGNSTVCAARGSAAQ